MNLFKLLCIYKSLDIKSIECKTVLKQSHQNNTSKCHIDNVLRTGASPV